MKSILKFGMAIAVVAVCTSAWASNPGDAIFFSTSPTDPLAGTSLSFNAANQTLPLYIWVTTAAAPVGDATNDAITQPNAGYSGNIALGAAAMNLSGSLTSAVSNLVTVDSVNYDNPTLTGKGIGRWSAISDSSTGFTGVSGSSFTNLEANAVLPNGQSGTLSGTQLGIATSNTAIDPLYFNVPNGQAGSFAGAWKVGTVNLKSGSTGGTGTYNLAAGGLDITKSQNPGATTILTSLYSYGSAAVNVNLNPTRTGDINGDGKVNAADIDLMSAKLLAGGLPYSTLYDYRGATVGSPPDGIIDINDKNRLFGSLIDINNVATSVGTHSGDADLNGTVAFGDYQTVLLNFGQSGKGWATGDFTGDGSVTFADYQQILLNFGQSGGTGQISQVPEPSGLILCGVGLVGLVATARRKSSRA